jgi:FkbM family methyltransferase
MSKINNLKHHLKNFLFEQKHSDANKYKKSYSQCGEDLIVRFIFDQLKISKPSYIDIGAHHPYIISNTSLLYLGGSKGVNVEPNPPFFDLFIKERPKDINLNIGISAKEQDLEYFEFNEPALNTFSTEEKENLIKEGKALLSSKIVSTNSLEHVINNYCDNRFPHFLSLDVEGYDMMILHQINFDKSFPFVICVETISFSTKGNGIKNKELIDFLVSNGYFLHSDTFINSIFVKQDIWKNK